jgi:hypothetical protein
MWVGADHRGHLSASDGVGVPQSRLGRCVWGRMVEQCGVTSLVRADSPRVPPAGALAWRGELEPHVSSRGSPGVGMAPRSRGLLDPTPPTSMYRPRPSRRRKLLVQMKLSGPRQRLVVRGGDLSEKPLTSHRLVGEATHRSETRRLASEGLNKDLQSSLCCSTSRVIISSLKGP